MFTLTSSDRPDISIGRRWSEDRKARGLTTIDRFAPLYLPDQDLEVPLLVYDDVERGTFETWFGRVYLPEKLPDYYGKKPSFKIHGELPPASAADHTCMRLTGNPANLILTTRQKLKGVGGFFPVGKELPKPKDTQQSLFGESSD
jgi:hypothetical protein